MAHPDDMACYLGCEVVKETLDLKSQNRAGEPLSRERQIPSRPYFYMRQYPLSLRLCVPIVLYTRCWRPVQMVAGVKSNTSFAIPTRRLTLRSCGWRNRVTVPSFHHQGMMRCNASTRPSDIDLKWRRFIHPRDLLATTDLLGVRTGSHRTAHAGDVLSSTPNAAKLLLCH
jgi:hypothetical protein